jgi:hypothetical protein
VNPNQDQFLNISNKEVEILSGLFMGDHEGELPANHQVRVLDNGNGQISAGDQVQLVDQNNNVIRAKNLTEANAYDIRFRSSLIDTATKIGTGWPFSATELVDIRNNTLAQPFTRTVQNEQGQLVQENVIEQNAFWEVVNDNGQHRLVMRETDDQGNNIRPSDALNDIFNNRENYAFDCATPMHTLKQKVGIE